MWISSFEWNGVFSMPSCEEKFNVFVQTLQHALDTFLPLQKLKMHSSDKPWITPKIKRWISMRQKCLARFGKNSSTFRSWRNKVSYAIKGCKKSYFDSKVASLKCTNISRWWSEIKHLSGAACSEGQWFYQLIDGQDICDIQSLCSKINEYFTSLTSSFTPLSDCDISNIVVDDIPDELYTTSYEVFKQLNSTKIRKASGPDQIPNLVLRSFAFELAPVLADIYNASLHEGYLPELLKCAIVCPIPKSNPAKSIEDDIRPVSLTSQISKIMEAITLTRILPSVLQVIDKKQFAVAGKSTSQAIAYILHLALKALDKGGCWVRLFFADFRKGFDLIDHKILLNKLSTLNFHPCLLRWLCAFLLGRKQCVRLSNYTSSYCHLKGGIPQGTKCGPLLFAVMVNDLIASWHPRVKFVDDLTILEIIPRNSPSVMQHIVNDIQKFTILNNMQLNPKKCKSMSIDFLQYNSCMCQPIVINGSEIES